MSGEPMDGRAASPARAGRTRAVCDRGAIAVVRLSSATQALAVVDALWAGGIGGIEVTLTTPGAMQVITALSRSNERGLLVGAGSVLDAEQAQRAVDAGASYLVSPVLRRDVLTVAHANDVPAMPGAFTPTEILAAHEAGADVVKVFPADALGPAFIRAVLAPMPFLRLMPTGGVTPENVAQWFAAGVVAVGLGSALVDAKLVEAGDFATITQRARAVSIAVANARGTSIVGNPPVTS